MAPQPLRTVGSVESTRKAALFQTFSKLSTMKNPEFYQDIKRVAEQNRMEYIEAFRISADQMKTLQAQEPDMWHKFVPGVLLWLDDCGMKMDSANNIGGVIETMNNGGDHIHSRLAMVEKIIDCTDEDLQLFNYSAGLPEGCTRGGSRCEDEKAAAAARELMNKQYIMPAEREAARKKYYNYFFSLVTMYRSENYCLFIDAEGYNWCRYILLLPSWRNMYAAELKAVEEAERRREEEAAADAFLAEVKAQIKYESDCARIRPWMVADLSSYELNDRQGRQNGRRRNIMAALRHFFPNQKFSVAYRYASHDELEIRWTDGPTAEEVEKCCNWSIFCDCWHSFDGMDDSWDFGNRKYTDFAQQYGGGHLDEIKFDRNFSADRTEATNAAARDLLASCGITATENGVHQSSPEYMNVWSAISNRYGKAVAEWLNAWSWLDSYAIGLSIMANNADRLAA